MTRFLSFLFKHQHAVVMSNSKEKKRNGAKFRKLMHTEKGRNWTDVGTDTFCTILADPVMNFSFTLETKALKKSTNKEVFEAIQSEFKTALLEPEFVEENKKNFEHELYSELDVSIPKLRNKYNNFKKKVEATG